MISNLSSALSNSPFFNNNSAVSDLPVEVHSKSITVVNLHDLFKSYIVVNLCIHNEWRLPNDNAHNVIHTAKNYVVLVVTVTSMYQQIG